MARTYWKRTVLAGSVAVATVLAAACLQRSLNPLFLPKDSVFDERLLGEWVCGEESWTFTRELDEDSGSKEFYRIDVVSRGRRGTLAAWLGWLDNNLFITFIPTVDIELPSPFFDRHLVGVFTFGRVTIEPDRLRLAMLGSEWAEKAFAAGQLTLGVNRTSLGPSADGLDIILTAQPDELQRFARAYASEDDVFSENIEFVRPVAGGATAPDSRGQCYSEK